jgi:cytochrome c-type biogenesis protein CcmE
MAQATWEKNVTTSARANEGKAINLKLVVSIGLFITALIFLISTATTSGARYFTTVDELVGNTALSGQMVRITGAVLGDTIRYDAEQQTIDFVIVHIPSETDNLALTLHNAVNDSSVNRLHVHIEGQVMPDLLRHEAQAILTGTLGADGIFIANELLLKCPSRYEEAVPVQAEGG